MTIRDLIDGLSRNDHQAWGEFWLMAESIALAPIRRIFHDRGLDPSLADDAMQELYLHFQADHQRRIRAFWGTTEAEFQAFVHTLAIRRTLKVVRTLGRIRRHEVQLHSDVEPPDQSGPTEQQIQAIRRDLKSLASEPDRRKLEILWASGDWDGGAAATGQEGIEPISPQTLRRWRRELFTKYGPQVL